MAISIISPRLNQQGKQEYPDLIREAIRDGNDTTLAEALRSSGRLNPTEERQTKRGLVTAKVPVTAPEILAEGEFNRFYARGLCRRAMEDGIQEVVAYRAKQVKKPRPESEAMIGKRLNAQALLEDLRNHIGVDPALGLPAGPNSGLSVHLP